MLGKSVYYNEIDAFAAAWLRELMKAGQIPDGEVDERSIELVHPDDVRGFTACHWFAGIGGWAYALRLAGWPDDRAVWTGSCPCQPFSSAGAQAGGHDPRDLWPVWFELVKECRPRVVFGEQVEAAIGHGWLDRLCDDLESEDYAVGAVGLPGPCVGAYDIRQRLWFVADSMCAKWWPVDGPLEDERNRDDTGREEAHGQPGTRREVFWADADWLPCIDGKARPVEPKYVAMVDGLSGDLVRGCDQCSEEGAAVDAKTQIDGDGRPGMRAVRQNELQAARSPQGSEPEERRAIELTDFVRLLPSSLALAELHGHRSTAEALHALLAASGAQRLVQYPPDQVEAAWRSLSQEAQDRFRLELGKGRFVRTVEFPLASGVPARVGRLRGYGNAIKPQLAAAFIESYLEVRNHEVIPTTRLR